VFIEKLLRRAGKKVNQSCSLLFFHWTFLESMWYLAAGDFMLEMPWKDLLENSDGHKDDDDNDDDDANLLCGPSSSKFPAPLLTDFFLLPLQAITQRKTQAINIRTSSYLQCGVLQSFESESYSFPTDP
jgi:hypothetical protein